MKTYLANCLRTGRPLAARFGLLLLLLLGLPPATPAQPAPFSNRLVVWSVLVQNTTAAGVNGVSLTFTGTGGTLKYPVVAEPSGGVAAIVGGNTVTATWLGLLPVNGFLEILVYMPPGLTPTFNTGQWKLNGANAGAIGAGVVAGPANVGSRASPGTGNVIVPNPPLHHSFVRDGGAIQAGNFPAPGQIVARDYEYAQDIADVMNSGTNFTEVDIVMQQCFGGGFLDAVQLTVPPPHTFASSTFWSEVSFDTGEINMRPDNGPAAAPGGWLDDFSRAWRQDAWDNAGGGAVNNDPLWPGGMLTHFMAAATGLPTPLPAAPPTDPTFDHPIILKEPFSRVQNTLLPFFVDFSEAPQYESTDFAGNGGSSDTRELASYAYGLALATNLNCEIDGETFTNIYLTNVIASAAAHQYAILVGWNETGWRDSWVDLARVYGTLRSLGVPAANIAVLDSSYTDCFQARIATIGPLGATGPTDEGGLPVQVPINDFNGRPEWLAALRGDYFTGAKPGEGDQMFIYNTGHGSHLIRIFGFEWEWGWFSNQTNAFAWTNLWQFTPVEEGCGCFCAATVPGVTTGKDTNDIVRLYLDTYSLTNWAPGGIPSAGLSPGATITVNGVYTTSLLLDTNPLPLNPEVETSETMSYKAIVPHWVWGGSSASFTNISLAVLDSTNTMPLDANMLVAVDLQGGEQEFLTVNTNSPDWISTNTGSASVTSIPLSVPPVPLAIQSDPTSSGNFVSWPPITNNAVVQVTHDLGASPIEWETLNVPITTVGNVMSYVLDTNSEYSASFYRLANPGP